MLLLGNEQYKYDVTFKDILIFFRDLVYEKAASVFVAISMFLLGLTNETLYNSLQLKDISQLSKVDKLLIVIAICLIILSIIIFCSLIISKSYRTIIR